MRTKKDLVLRPLGDQFILVAEGNAVADFTQMVSMNASSAYLWDAVEGKDFELATLVDLLVEAYGIPKDQAEHDAAVVLDDWKRIGIME
ncbi:MAG: PqqD family protein [Bacteroidales bacterium]|nr:PqqD family protein [Bacteroidales bacterium]